MNKKKKTKKNININVKNKNKEKTSKSKKETVSQKQNMTKKKQKIKKVLTLLLSIICLFGIVYSVYNIIHWKDNVDKNGKVKDDIKDLIVEKEDETIVDFTKLKEQNPDTVAYLKVNNTNIDYVVVKGENNSYYLNHNFNKESNIAGWIFADYKNKFDGTDKNIVIYGHNTKDGSMFGTLKNILDEKWQDNLENREITLITENETIKYQVFSTYIIIPEDYYINTEFGSDEEFFEFLNELKSRSTYDFNVEVNPSDTILTLSSCNLSGSKRIVLHAKRIDN